MTIWDSTRYNLGPATSATTQEQLKLLGELNDRELLKLVVVGQGEINDTLSRIEELMRLVLKH